MEVKLPKLGLTMEDGVVLEWLVRIGASVESGTQLVVVETDKVETVIESPVTGRVSEILVGPAETCLVGGTLCLIEEP